MKAQRFQSAMSIAFVVLALFVQYDGNTQTATYLVLLAIWAKLWSWDKI